MFSINDLMHHFLVVGLLPSVASLLIFERAVVQKGICEQKSACPIMLFIICILVYSAMEYAIVNSFWDAKELPTHEWEVISHDAAESTFIVGVMVGVGIQSICLRLCNTIGSFIFITAGLYLVTQVIGPIFLLGNRSVGEAAELLASAAKMFGTKSNPYEVVVGALITAILVLLATIEYAMEGVAVMSSHLNRYKDTTKFVSFLFTLLVALLGFYVLDGFKVVIWLLFFVVSYPVILAFTGSLLDGTLFSAAQLKGIYKDSARFIPIIRKLIK